MKRRTFAASVMLAFLLTAVVLLAAQPAVTAQRTASHAVPGAARGCARLYTVAMATRAARVAYSGTRTVTQKDLRHLSRYLRCQRNLNAKWFVRWEYRHQRSLWHARLYPPMYQAYVSQYDDSGGHCCGYYATYGVAVCGSYIYHCVPMGTRIKFCYPWWSSRNCVMAVADDHGPYAGRREFDLSDTTAAAIGFPGLGTVGYHIY